MRAREREKERECVCEREKARERVCVRQRERARDHQPVDAPAPLAALKHPASRALPLSLSLSLWLGGCGVRCMSRRSRGWWGGKQGDAGVLADVQRRASGEWAAIRSPSQGPQDNAQSVPQVYPGPLSVYAYFLDFDRMCGKLTDCVES